MLDLDNTPRATEEIIARIKEVEGSVSDFFGTISSDLLTTLTFEQAKPWLKDEATSADWKQSDRTVSGLLKEIRDYLPFAWGKANNQRGLSACRSINHMQAWLWLLGEEQAAEEIGDYDMYGKPQLRAISEAVGFDWRAEDDGDWSNTEGGPYRTADDVPALRLTFTGSLASAEAQHAA